MVDEHLPGLRPDFVALRDGAIAPATGRPGAGEVGAGAGELDDERLQGRAAGLHRHAEVGVELELIGGDGDVAEADDMDLGRERSFVPRLLALVALHDAPVPPEERLIPLVGRQLADLFHGEVILPLRHHPAGKLDPIDAVIEGNVGELLLLGARERLLPAGDDPPRDLVEPGEAPQSAHPFFGGLAEHQMGRLIAGGAGPGEDMEPRTMLLPQPLADRMPEVGVDLAVPLHLLGRTGDVDRRRQQGAVGLPDKQRVDGMVFIALEHPERRPIGGAIHDGVVVGIDAAPVVGDDRMPHPPADGARRARLPRLLDPRGDPGGEEVDILWRRHDTGGKVVDAVDEDRCGVGVGGAGDDPFHREVGDPGCHLGADRRQGLIGNGDNVAGDEGRRP